MEILENWKNWKIGILEVWQKMLVYSDDRQKDYKLQDCNGWEIFRIDYCTGIRMYQVWSQSKQSANSLGCLDYFDTLKEARAFARAN